MMKEEQVRKVVDNLDDYLHGKTSELHPGAITYMRENRPHLYDKFLSLLNEEYNYICGVLYHQDRLKDDADRKQIKINFDK